MIIEEYASQYIGKLKNLSEKKKIILGLCNLVRQEGCVHQFDNLYNETLATDYDKILSDLFSYVQGKPTALMDKKFIASLAPDTDDYPENEGTIAQNAFGALYYLYAYVADKKDSDFFQSLEKSFESVDALKYENGTEEEENEYFTNEAKNLQDLLDEVDKSITDTFADINPLLVLSRKLSLV